MRKYNRERRKSLGLSNSSDSTDEKRGEIIHHRLARQWYRKSFTPDHPLSSQQLSVASSQSIMWVRALQIQFLCFHYLAWQPIQLPVQGMDPMNLLDPFQNTVGVIRTTRTGRWNKSNPLQYNTIQQHYNLLNLLWLSISYTFYELQKGGIYRWVTLMDCIKDAPVIL